MDERELLDYTADVCQLGFMSSHDIRKFLKVSLQRLRALKVRPEALEPKGQEDLEDFSLET